MRLAVGRNACVVCNGDAGLFGGRRLLDGSHICKACLASIPVPFLEGQYAAAEDSRNDAEYGKGSIKVLSPAFMAMA